MRYLIEDIKDYWRDFKESKFFIILPIVIFIISILMIVNCYLTYNKRVQTINHAKSEVSKLDKKIENMNEKIEFEKKNEKILYSAKDIGDQVSFYQTKLLQITDPNGFDYKEFLDENDIKKYVKGDSYYKSWLNLNNSEISDTETMWKFKTTGKYLSDSFNCLWVYENNKEIIALAKGIYNDKDKSFSDIKIEILDSGKDKFNKDLNTEINKNLEEIVKGGEKDEK